MFNRKIKSFTSDPVKLAILLIVLFFIGLGIIILARNDTTRAWLSSYNKKESKYIQFIEIESGEKLAIFNGDLFSGTLTETDTLGNLRKCVKYYNGFAYSDEYNYYVDGSLSKHVIHPSKHFLEVQLTLPGIGTRWAKRTSNSEYDEDYRIREYKYDIESHELISWAIFENSGGGIEYKRFECHNGYLVLDWKENDLNYEVELSIRGKNTFLYYDAKKHGDYFYADAPTTLDRIVFKPSGWQVPLGAESDNELSNLSKLLVEFDRKQFVSLNHISPDSWWGLSNDTLWGKPF